MEPSPAPLVPFLLGLAVSAGLMLPSLLRLRSRLAGAEERRSAADEQARELERSHGRLAEDLRSLTQFVNDYPRLARELYGGLGERQIPQALLAIVRRALDPQRAAVLVRRSETRGARRDPGGAGFVVAAAYPGGAAALEVGTDLPADVGEVGFVAETQRLVSREDLQMEPAGRIKPGPALAGMPQPDILAPLVVEHDTVGMILVQNPRRAGDAKTVLRLLAETGAQVLHSAVQVGYMRTTAEMDGLTRVHNKRHMEQVLNDLLYRVGCAAYDGLAQGRPHMLPSVSVFLFDIDHFKHYNDTNGHLAGDELLRELAALVNETVRKDDVFGRFGGEEFLLVLPHTGIGHALALAEKIRQRIARHPFAFAGKQPLGHLSVSGGVAEYPRDGADAAALLHAADAALYGAKHAGRDRVLRANPAGPPASSAAG